MPTKRKTSKYLLKVGNKVVHGGISDNPNRRLREHLNSGNVTTANDKMYDWSNAHMVLVGNKSTRKGALKWERENCFGANQKC